MGVGFAKKPSAKRGNRSHGLRQTSYESALKVSRYHEHSFIDKAMASSTGLGVREYG